ncbi:MAG TPA: hypothetical protein VN086_00475 [Candidatus Paceibacterota bacterium]|nr:hypothetical protein [Candidatus Paceibacterota bacterium]
MNEITIGDKVYISAKRAAEITGYARDYVGQLCREGHVDAKMVGRSWYVFEPSIRAHRFGAEAPAPQEQPVSSQSEAEMAEVPSDIAAEEPVTTNPATQSDWQAPTYSAEAPDMLPELTPARLEELLPPAEETLTDMQAAWREWFEEKQKVLETPEIESPEVIDARNELQEEEYEPEEALEAPEEYESEAVSVPLQRIEEDTYEEQPVAEEQVAEVVAIHHIVPEPARMDMPRETAPVRQEIPSAPRYSGEYAVPQAVHGRVITERIVTKKGGRARSRKASSLRTNAPIIAVLIGISLISITIAAIGTGYASRYLRTLPSENSPVINFLVGTQKFSR